MNYPIWINADILPGPKKANTKPVDADDFLKGCRQLPNATLSIGWTTYWNFIPSWAKYSADHINEMVNVLDRASYKEHCMRLRIQYELVSPQTVWTHSPICYFGLKRMQL